MDLHYKALSDSDCFPDKHFSCWAYLPWQKCPLLNLSLSENITIFILNLPWLFIFDLDALTSYICMWYNTNLLNPLLSLKQLWKWNCTSSSKSLYRKFGKKIDTELHITTISTCNVTKSLHWLLIISQQYVFTTCNNADLCVWIKIIQNANIQAFEIKLLFQLSWMTVNQKH